MTDYPPPSEKATVPDSANVNGTAFDPERHDVGTAFECETSEEILNSSFSLAFHHSPIACAITRLADGKILRVNNKMAKLSQRSESELLGRTTLDVKLWQSLPDRDRLMARLAERGQLEDVPFTYDLPGGGRLHLRLWLSVVTAGPCRYVVTCAYDATELIRKTEELSASQQLFQRLTEIVPVGIFRTDSHGNCDFVNEECTRLAGRPASELLGFGWHDTIHPDDRARVLQIFDGFAESGGSATFETRCVSANREDRWVLCRFTATPASDGALSLIGSLTDITERKRSEHSLQQEHSKLKLLVDRRTRELAASESQWRALIENAPDQILTLKRDHVVTFINYTVPGLTLDDVLGRPAEDFLAPPYRERAGRAVDEVFETGQTVQVDEVVGWGPHGTPAWYSAKIAPIKNGDDVEAALVICRDTTAQKEAEEKMRQRDREAHQTERNLIAGSMGTVLIHELAHPLWSLHSFVEGAILRIESDEFSLDEARNVLKEIGASTERAVDVLHRLREIHKRAGARDFVPVELGPVIAGVLDPFQTIAREHGFVITTDIVPEDIAVIGDELLFGQAIGNLVQNAIDALIEAEKSSGAVTVSVRRADLHAIVTVADNGPGLTIEQKMEVLKPWYTTKRHGLGIGLTLCRQIIEQMHGHIWIEDDPVPIAEAASENGLTVRFRLPVAKLTEIDYR